MPLRTRLALIFIAFFAAALIVLEAATYLVVRQTLIASMDNELDIGATVITKDFASSNETVPSYFNGKNMVLLLNQPALSNLQQTTLLAQVYNDKGDVVTSSANLPEPLTITDADREAVLNGQTLLRINAGERSTRQMLVPLKLGQRPIGVLQLARPMGDTNRALGALFWALLGGGALVLFAAARGGLWLTSASLRSIDEITATAQSIVGAEDLSRRVPLPETQDELQRLTVTINDLLGRLEGLFGAQRRFVADVSHELRTPLAAMQGNLDVLARGAWRDPQLLAESLADMRSEVSRLIRMVNDLLLLARSEAGFELRREPVELETLVIEVHRELRSFAGPVQLRITFEDQVMVNGDRDRLKQALLNLTVNALQHTPAGGTVTISLTTTGQQARITVADTGSGIDAESLPHIFDRFYRADRSRSRGVGGAGLGLAIVKWIAEAHSGTIEVSSTPGVGSSFTLVLPQDPALVQAPGPPLLADTFDA